VLRHGPVYVPIDLPANSVIEEIDLWGDSAYVVGTWDSQTLPPPLPPFILPHHELVGFGLGDTNDSFTFFATDGINQAPYYELHYQLRNPFLLAAGRYYVGVDGFPMVGASQAVFFTNAFTSDVTPADLLSPSVLPGVAIRVVGQVVPEPSLLLMLPGAALLWCRARVRSRPATGRHERTSRSALRGPRVAAIAERRPRRRIAA